MQVVDELGHRTLETMQRTIGGYGGAFRLVPFNEVVRLPAESPSGASIRLLVILANPTSGEGFAYAEVSFRRQ